MSKITNRGKLYDISVNYLALDNKQMPIIKFTYDFEPITTIYLDTGKSFSEFLISLCAIVGGWYAITLLATKFLIK